MEMVREALRAAGTAAAVYPAVRLVLLLVNLAAFALYGADKRRAVRGCWRIPERTLFWAAAFGGPGALVGMYGFRHKTKHLRFRLWVPLCALAQLLLWGAALWATRG